jgi:hypothetical protein
MGWYTITGTAGQKTGWATTTQTVTTTQPGGSVATLTATKTATIVAAAASATTGTVPSAGVSIRVETQLKWLATTALGVIIAFFLY